MGSIYKNKRSKILRLYDSIMLPVRGVFLGTEGVLGLSSIRDERMRIVASYCSGRVLDIGCGPGNYFVKTFIGEENGIGIDVFQYDGVDNIVTDMEMLPYDDEMFDTITLVAVGGHIPKEKRVSEFKEFTRVLRTGGKLIMTEGEPITQYLRHNWLYFYLKIQGRIDVDSERGMEEEEEYCMPKEEIYQYLNTPPLRFYLHQSFQWRLNNIYIAVKEEH